MGGRSFKTHLPCNPNTNIEIILIESLILQYMDKVDPNEDVDGGRSGLPAGQTDEDDIESSVIPIGKTAIKSQ